MRYVLHFVSSVISHLRAITILTNSQYDRGAIKYLPQVSHPELRNVKPACREARPVHRARVFHIPLKIKARRRCRNRPAYILCHGK